MRRDNGTPRCASVIFDQSHQRRRPEQWSISVQDQNGSGAAGDFGLGAEYGMSRAALLRLKSEVHSRNLDSFRDSLALMADNDRDSIRRCDPQRRAEHVAKNGVATGAVEYFRLVRSHSRT